MAAKSFDKLVEEIGNMSVIELSEFVDTLKEQLKIADMPIAAAPAAAAAPTEAKAEEKAEYEVTLLTSGPEKIKTIKALRAVIANLSLGDAKKYADEAPTVIAEAAPKEEAEKMKKELEAVGATVKLS